MTENEQKIINKISDLSGDYKCYDNRINHEESLVLDRLLSEIQQYRAIETELREQYHANVNIKILMQHFIETIFKGEKHEGFCILTNEDAKMWDEYQAIGTIDEFKALKEKSVAKKPHSISIADDIGNSMVECPICHARSDYDVKSIKRGYCWKCGQKLDWSE